MLQKQLSMMRTGIANQETVQNEWSTICGDEELPLSFRECSTLLRLTKKEIKDIVSQSFERREQERQKRIAFLANSGKPRDQEQATILRNLQKSEEIEQ